MSKMKKNLMEVLGFQDNNGDGKVNFADVPGSFGKVLGGQKQPNIEKKFPIKMVGIGLAVAAAVAMAWKAIFPTKARRRRR